MDTKSTNRYIILFFLSCLFFGLSIIGIKDISINQGSLKKNNTESIRYTSTNEFRSEVDYYMISVLDLNTIYKDFDNQTYSEREEKYDGYSQALNTFKLRPSFQYYLVDKKTKKIYTNISNISDVNKYIEKKSLYYIKFNKGEDKHGPIVPYNLFNSKLDKFEAYFVIPKAGKGNDNFVDSILVDDSIAVNPIKDRVKRELMILPIIMGLAIGIYIFLFHLKKEKILFIGNIRKAYKKVPIDLRIFVFVVTTIILNLSYGSINFFQSINPSDYMEIIFASIYVMYIIVIIQSVFKGKREKGEFAEECKKV